MKSQRSFEPFLDGLLNVQLADMFKKHGNTKSEEG